MATIDEVFATMSATGADEEREYLVIDAASRSITVPEAETIFGVESDTDAERKYFIAPRYVGDKLDLASMFLTVNYRNANGDEDGYLVEDLVILGEFVTFSWLLSPKVVAYKGVVQFSVCADLPNTTNRRGPDWNTTLASGEVLEGLDPDRGDVEGETSDVVTQLRADVAAQTAAVEACGTAQVAAVEAAATAATATATEQIETKGAATLAAIPAEYTTLANKTNEQANAIKGSLSGEIVQAQDVSPVEHYLGVKVHGKNLFNLDDASGTLYGVTYSTAAKTAEIQLDGAATEECALTFTKTIKLAAGTYTASVYGLNTDETNGHDRLFIRNAGTSAIIINHITALTPRTFTLEEETEIRCYMVMKSGSTYEGATVTVQIEQGTEATDYTAYIDPSAVTVTRCGKNLLPYPFTDTTVTRRGITFTDNGDGTVTINGTAEAGTSFVLFEGEMAVNGSYVLSGLSGGSGATCYVQPFCSDKAYPGLTDGYKAYDWSGTTLNKVLVSIAAGATITDLTIAPMLELGEAATPFEAYEGVTAMPAEDGTTEGLTSLAPTMTLLTDTAGVMVECAYNRDSNAVYAELLAMIAALSGTT